MLLDVVVKVLRVGQGAGPNVRAILKLTRELLQDLPGLGLRARVGEDLPAASGPIGCTPVARTPGSRFCQFWRSPGECPSQSRADLLGSLFPHPRHHVRVHVQRDADARMPESLRGDLWVDPGLVQLRGVRVPQTVEAA